MSYRSYLFAIFAVGFCVSSVAAQEEPAKPSETATPETSERAPRIDMRADQRVQAMSQFLAKQQKFRFNVEITYDAIEPDGQKVQLGRRSLVEVMRPNGLRAESQGDRGWNQMGVYDGKHFLYHDRAQKVFSRIETPATLEEFFNFLFEKYGASPPLSDFLLKDVHGALTSNAETGALLGDAFVAEQECDHVAFTGEQLDWQIWIQKGDTPWPRKFVITYKDVEERPQYMAVFRQWETDVALQAARFETSTPSGATEVNMERLTMDDSAKEGEIPKETPSRTTETPKGD